MIRRNSRLLAWLLSSALFAWMLLDFYWDVILMGNAPTFHSKRLLLFVFIGLPLSFAGVAIFGWIAWRGRFPAWIGKAHARLLRIPHGLRLVFVALILMIPAYAFVWSNFGFQPSGYGLRFGAICTAALLAAIFLFPMEEPARWLVRWAFLVALAGVLFLVSDSLTPVSNYPFSIGWSEGNRLWDYSVLFGSGRYLHLADHPIFAFITPGRQLLWALPFLIPGIQIWAVRLWDAVLWVAPALLLGLLALPRTSCPGKTWFWSLAFAVWTYLYLSQGPIYAPLVVSAILVVLALRLKNLLLAALLVALASAFAAVSRWTWAYAPGLWAGLFSLLVISSPTLRKPGWKALIKPVVLGISGFLGGQFLPLLFQGSQFGATSQVSVAGVLGPEGALSRQPLLWYRLFPNATFAPGILLGMLWVLLPVLLFLLVLAWKRVWRVNLLQGLAISVILLAFLGVGLVASTKIGGGSNLHNLDMLWITCVLLVAWAVKDALANAPEVFYKGWLAVCLSLALLAPAAFAMQPAEKITLPSAQETTDSLDGVRSAVKEYAPQGEILFLDQRQLLTFAQVPGVPLVADYEKKYLMEQALRANLTYFQAFYADLSQKRFVLIVSEPLNARLQEDAYQFGEENDAWVRYVSIPVMCYYQPLTTFSAVGVQLLVPRSQPLDPCMLPQLKN
jgi:hypothetical protein